MKEQAELPEDTKLDSNEPIVSDAGSSSVIVTSAVCTHLGCIPIPYLGAYNGYVKFQIIYLLGLYLPWKYLW